MPALRYPLPPATIDDIARASGCSARTVRRYLGGQPVSGRTCLCISGALRARKLDALVRATPSQTAERAA